MTLCGETHDANGKAAHVPEAQETWQGQMGPGLLGAVLGFVLAVTLAVGLCGPALARPKSVELTAGSPPTEFAFTPHEVVLSFQRPAVLTLRNHGRVVHDLHIAALRVKMSPVAPGRSASVAFIPTVRGTFEFFCTIPGHKEVGMKGVLVVR
jgi:uncharacterized cupredoxin-like copper-binding protein